MQAHDLRAIPVVDDDRRVEGVLSVLDVMGLFFQNDNDPVKSRTVATCLEKIHDSLGGEFQHVVDPLRRDELMVMVGAMSAEGFTERMKRFPAEQLLVVCGDRPTIHLPAIEHGVRVLVITGGFTLSSGLVELAKLRGVSVVTSPFDTLNTVLRIRSAQFIDPVVDRDVVTIDGKAAVTDARGVVERSSQPVFPVVGDDGRLVGYCFKTDIVNPPKPQLVLVDHNELGQAVAGAEDAERLAVNFGALEGFPVPFAAAHGAVRGGNLPGERAEHEEGQFGGGDRVAAGGVHHHDAALGGGGDIHVVHTHAGAADDLELFGGFENLGRHLGFGAHDHGVHVRDEREQLGLGEPLGQDGDLELRARLEKGDAAG
jgi:CBS domain-containing protein